MLREARAVGGGRAGAPGAHSPLTVAYRHSLAPSAAEGKRAPEPPAAAHRAKPEHGEEGEERTLTAASTGRHFA